MRISSKSYATLLKSAVTNFETAYSYLTFTQFAGNLHPTVLRNTFFLILVVLFFTAVYLFHCILRLRSVIPPIAVFGTFSFTPSDGLLGGFLQVIYLPISVSRF